MAALKPEDRAPVEKSVKRVTVNEGVRTVRHEVTTKHGEFIAKTYKAAMKLAHAKEDEEEATLERHRKDYDQALLKARGRAWQLMAKCLDGRKLGYSYAYIAAESEHFRTFATPHDFGQVLKVDGEEYRVDRGVAGVVVDNADNVLAYVTMGDSPEVYAVACVNFQKTDARCPGVTLAWLDQENQENQEKAVASDATVPV